MNKERDAEQEIKRKGEKEQEIRKDRYERKERNGEEEQ